MREPERGFSGVPNTSSGVIPWFDCGGGFSYTVWNARAVQHNDASIRRRKALEIKRLCDKFNVVVLLECHGSEESLRRTLRLSLRTHSLLYSPFKLGNGTPQLGTGGVAVLVGISLNVSPQLEPIVHGRVVRLILKGGQGVKELRGWFVHNFGISSAQMNTIERALNKDLRGARADPLALCVALSGDFNLEPSDFPRIKLTEPLAPWAEGADSDSENTPQRRVLQTRWESIFAQLTEVKTNLPTHVNISD